MTVLGLLLYVGPDQILPFASALAAVGGAVMLFWRQVKTYARRLLPRSRRR
jgi:hypothetical protein